MLLEDNLHFLSIPTNTYVILNYFFLIKRFILLMNFWKLRNRLLAVPFPFVINQRHFSDFSHFFHTEFFIIIHFILVFLFNSKAIIKVQIITELISWESRRTSHSGQFFHIILFFLLDISLTLTTFFLFMTLFLSLINWLYQFDFWSNSTTTFFLVLSMRSPYWIPFFLFIFILLILKTFCSVIIYLFHTPKCFLTLFIIPSNINWFNFLFTWFIT